MAKRRLNGEGTITWHKGNKAWLVSIYSAENGTRVTRYAKTQREAKKKLRELQRKQEDGMPLVSSGMYLKDYLNEWLEIIKPRLRPNTKESYEVFTRVHLIPRLGHIKLNKLTPEQVNKAWSKMLGEGHSATLVEHCHARLAKALNDAIRRNLIHGNPCQFVTKPRVVTQEIRPLSDERGWRDGEWVPSEIEQVLKGAEDTEYYSIIHTALHTALRRNELLGLRWKDVNLDEACIYLSRSIYREKDWKTTYHPPKTKSGIRSVDLTPPSALHLRLLRQKQERDAGFLGYEVTDNSPVFIRRTGEPLLPDAVTHGFKKIVRKLGLGDVRFHDLRHTHATVLAKQGVHPKVVQERLGHSRLSTTMDIYSHVMPSMQKEAAEKFAKALETPIEPPIDVEIDVRGLTESLTA